MITSVVSGAPVMLTRVFELHAPQGFFVLKPDGLFLFHSMKRKQKSCQNEPSAGRFDGPRAASIKLV